VAQGLLEVLLVKMMALPQLYLVMVQRLKIPMVQESVAETAQEVGVSHSLTVLLDQKVAVPKVAQGVAATKVAQEVGVIFTQELLEVFPVKTMALPYLNHVMV
jgi:hypothetical protein